MIGLLNLVTCSFFLSFFLFFYNCVRFERECTRLPSNRELPLQMIEVLAQTVAVQVAAIQVGERQTQRTPDGLRHLLNFAGTSRLDSLDAIRLRVQIGLALLHQGRQKVFDSLPFKFELRFVFA